MPFPSFSFHFRWIFSSWIYFDSGVLYFGYCYWSLHLANTSFRFANSLTPTYFLLLLEQKPFIPPSFAHSNNRYASYCLHFNEHFQFDNLHLMAVCDLFHFRLVNKFDSIQISGLWIQKKKTPTALHKNSVNPVAFMIDSKYDMSIPVFLSVSLSLSVYFIRVDQPRRK